MRRLLFAMLAMALFAFAGPAVADAPATPLRLAQAAGERATAPSDETARIVNPAPTPVPQPAARAEDDAQITFKTPWEVYLIAMTMALGFIFIGLFCWVFWKKGANETFLRYFVILTVIFAALFLIVAGYSERQTAPVFGLLGTIAGYIFGRVASTPEPPRDPRAEGERP